MTSNQTGILFSILLIFLATAWSYLVLSDTVPDTQEVPIIRITDEAVDVALMEDILTEITEQGIQCDKPIADLIDKYGIRGAATILVYQIAGEES